MLFRLLKYDTVFYFINSYYRLPLNLLSTIFTYIVPVVDHQMEILTMLYIVTSTPDNGWTIFFYTMMMGWIFGKYSYYGPTTVTTLFSTSNNRTTNGYFRTLVNNWFYTQFPSLRTIFTKSVAFTNEQSSSFRSLPKKTVITPTPIIINTHNNDNNNPDGNIVNLLLTTDTNSSSNYDLPFSNDLSTSDKKNNLWTKVSIIYILYNLRTIVVTTATILGLLYRFQTLVTAGIYPAIFLTQFSLFGCLWIIIMMNIVFAIQYDISHPLSQSSLPHSSSSSLSTGIKNNGEHHSLQAFFSIDDDILLQASSSSSSSSPSSSSSTSNTPNQKNTPNRGRNNSSSRSSVSLRNEKKNTSSAPSRRNSNAGTNHTSTPAKQRASSRSRQR